jgi:alcohol dehydrogenase class IV
MRRAAKALPRAFSNPGDQDARADMSFASLLGGMALANAGLGAVHGFAAPIGGMFPAPHGAVCAALLPHATEVNLRALRARAPESDALRRYEEAARLFDGSRDPVPFLAALVREFGIPPLAAYGLTAGDVPVLVEKASQASSMKGNPIKLTEEELREIAARAL